MKTNKLILTLTASFGLGIAISSAATVAFTASLRTSTDVDWPNVPTNPSPFPSVTVAKNFTGDNSENLSLQMVLTAGGTSTNLRIDGSNTAQGWQPDGGDGVQSYRWADGEEATWVISILDLDNASADVTASYQVNLTSLLTTNNGAIPDDATLTLTNGLSASNTAVARADTGTKVTNFTDFDGTSMTLSMSNNPADSPHYFRVNETTFEVTPIPEPSSFSLAALGLLGLMIRRKR